VRTSFCFFVLSLVLRFYPACPQKNFDQNSKSLLLLSHISIHDSCKHPDCTTSLFGSPKLQATQLVSPTPALLWILPGPPSPHGSLIPPIPFLLFFFFVCSNRPLKASLRDLLVPSFEVLVFPIIGQPISVFSFFFSLYLPLLIFFFVPFCCPFNPLFFFVKAVGIPLHVCWAPLSGLVPFFVADPEKIFPPPAGSSIGSFV